MSHFTPEERKAKSREEIDQLLQVRNKHLINVVVSDYKKRTRNAREFISDHVRQAVLWQCIGSIITAQSDCSSQGLAEDFRAIFNGASEKLGFWT